MKKNILLMTCIITSALLYGQEYKFEYITDDIFFHKPIFFEPSNYDRFFPSKDHSTNLHYEGWIDSTGTPRCYGKIVEINNVLVSGQIKDGQFDGWCSSREIGFDGMMKWQDSSQTIVPVGWGRSSIPFTYVSDQANGGLSISGNQNYYLVEQGSQISQLNALDAYKKLLYDNNKQYIKKVCSEKGLKYVEDVELGVWAYTGGWKDGKPYLFGAYKDHPRCENSYIAKKVVFCGYFNYESKDYTFSADDKGSWTEYHHVTYNPFTYHQHTITSPNLITDVDINFGHYSKTISDSKGNVLEYEVIKFEDGLYSKGKAIGNEYYWGVIVGRYDFYEGIIASTNGKVTGVSPVKYGKSISSNGDIQDASLKSKNEKIFFKFENGDSFLQELTIEGYTVGDYTYENGAYVIGLFGRRGAWYNNQGYVPIYAEAYDKNGEIVKSYVDTPRGVKTDKVEEYIQWLKKRHPRPISGYGMVVEDNSKYEGEFYARMYNGKGKLTYNDGTYCDGLWKNGAFVSGTSHYKTNSGEYIGGQKGDSPHGIGKFTYNDGSYKDGTWEDGNFKAGELYQIYDDGTSFKGICELFHAKEGTFTTLDGTKVNRTWEMKENKIVGRSVTCNVPNEHVDIMYPNGSEYHGPCYKFYNEREYSLEGDSVVILDSIGNRYIGGWGPLGRVGNGIDVFANGDSINTSWQDNIYVPDAEFTYTWSDGRKFVGVAGKKGKIGKGVYFNPDGSEASKKECKSWVMQTPTTMDIHENPVKRNFP